MIQNNVIIVIIIIRPKKRVR